MRKGYMLVEMLIVIAMLVVISIPISKFTKLLMFDVPKSAKYIEANTSLLNLLDFMKSDVAMSFKFHTAGKNMLIMQMADETVSYTFAKDNISRTTTDGNAPSAEWIIPGGRMDIEILSINDTSALSVTKYVEVETRLGIEKKMAETYLFFSNVFQDAKK